MNKIKNKAKLFYSFTIKCLSPISVGNGEDIETDHDIIRYSNNQPYIPASTISGVFFSKQSNARRLYSIGSTKDFSPLFISDGVFIGDYVESSRDGNKLDYNIKTSLNTAVFNYKTIEKGASFSFFIEYTLINDIDINDIRNDILEISSKINNGLYRIGFKQNRGLGKLEVTSLKEKIFEFNNLNLEEYLQFSKNIDVTLEKCNMIDITNDIKKIKIEMESIVALLKPISLINIKSKSRLKENTDSKALTLINNENIAVIPGSSLNGALRAYAYKLAKKDHKEYLFRNSNYEDFNTRYVIDDLYVEGHLITKQRTKINRFTGGADDSALFDEKVFMPKALIDDSSLVKFTISFYKDIDIEAKNYLIKSVKALCDGLVAVGAETSIGYGLFEGEIVNGEFNDVDINL